MRFLAFISLFSVFLLSWSNPFVQEKGFTKKRAPEFIKQQQRKFKDQFRHPQNANVLWAFLTGEQTAISPYTKKSFKKLELGLLFSPSGLHLGAFLSLFYYLTRKLKNKKLSRIFQWIFLAAAYFLPYLAIKRIVCLRFLFLLQRLFKKRVPVEVLFLATFIISFLLGHFKESPLGFIFSFLFMGTFIALRDHSRIFIILGLFSAHLIIGFFSGDEISPLALLLNLPLIALFSFILPFFYLYFISFQWVDFNWIEIFVRCFIVIVQWTSKLTQGTFVSSTLFLVLAVWVILLKKQKRYLLILLVLHGNTANSPAFFYYGSYSGAPQRSAHR